MAYNLPPAWDAGYALPSNVKDEGLERRAFVTRQMPRGTYDAPDVGTGGYAVPDYVLDEGIGQGTFVTDWQKSGTYNGPRVPHWLNQRPQTVSSKANAGGGQVVTIARQLAGMGDDAMPPLFQRFGHQASTVIMGHVAKLPAGQRKPQLKRILTAIDPTLWKRTAEITRSYHAQGVPPNQALHAGLAKALSSGIAAEIIHTGRSRTMPKARSLMGMGCYGCAAVAGALGATPGAVNIRSIVATVAQAVGAGAKPSSGMCSADGKFIWDTSSGAGAWRRLNVGEVCSGTWDGSGPATGGVQGGVKTTTTAGQIQVGPWVFARNRPSSMIMKDPSALTPDVATYLKNILTTVQPPVRQTGNANQGPTQPFYYRDHYVDLVTGAVVPIPPSVPQACTWLDAIGIQCATLVNPQIVKGKTGYYNELGTVTGGTPFFFYWFAPPDVADLNWEANYPPVAQFQHPDNPTGDPWGVYISLYDSVPGNSSPGSPVWFKVYTAPIPQAPWYQSILNAIGWLTASVIDLAGDAIGLVGDLACGVINAPGAQKAGSTVGGAAGQAGVAAGQAICGGGTPPPPPVPESSDFLPVAMIGGAVLAAALLLRRKKT